LQFEVIRWKEMEWKVVWSERQVLMIEEGETTMRLSVILELAWLETVPNMRSNESFATGFEIKAEGAN